MRAKQDFISYSIRSTPGDLSALETFAVNLKTAAWLDRYPSRQHALRVAQSLGVERGLIYLPGERTVNWPDSDQPRPFRQLRYFLYLAGCEESDCSVTYDIATDKLTLWLAPIDPRRVVWTGRGSTVDEALDKYDIDEARYSSSLGHFLKCWPQKNVGDVYVLHPDSTASEFISSRINSKDLQPAMDACRAIKDSHEIALIKKANHVSALAHENVLKRLRSFKNEAQVEAEVLETCIAHGAKHQAYEIIAGSGPNASILHYVKNDEDFKDRQLMCLDAGAEWQGYAADVTRTFPLSGNWPSKESKQIYDLVQRMQTRCMDILGPGKRFVDAQYLAHLVAIEGLLELGILHNGSQMEIYKAGTSIAFFPHGLGHPMGLEVHDVSPPTTNSFTSCSTEALDSKIAREFLNVENSEELRIMSANVAPQVWSNSLNQQSSPVLQPGMVITVEPGIYFNREALESTFLPSPIHSKYINKTVLERFMAVGGVRIEDDLLITSDGWENLTTAAKGEAALKIIRGEA